MPKLKATWDTPIALTPKGHAAAFYVLANEQELETVCNPATRENRALVEIAAENVRALSGLMKWQGIDRADVRTLPDAH